MPMQREVPSWTAAQRRARAWRWFRILLAGGVAAACSYVTVVAPPIRCFCESKTAVARITARKLADEAYPRWAAHQPSGACPASLEELTPWMDSNSTRDPWGTPYVMFCLPGRFYVASLGPDAVPGTADDIWSAP